MGFMKDFCADVFHNGMTECQVCLPVPHSGIGAIQLQGQHCEPVCIFQFGLLFQHSEFFRTAAAGDCFAEKVKCHMFLVNTPCLIIIRYHTLSSVFAVNFPAQLVKAVKKLTVVYGL